MRRSVPGLFALPELPAVAGGDSAAAPDGSGRRIAAAAFEFSCRRAFQAFFVAADGALHHVERGVGADQPRTTGSCW